MLCYVITLARNVMQQSPNKFTMLRCIKREKSLYLPSVAISATNSPTNIKHNLNTFNNI